ncbi:MAG: response regulator transcription factor [Rhizobiaceae bacterium]|nr:response regulator transcription factor [Rhizobiaceae bacterium]
MVRRPRILLACLVMDFAPAFEDYLDRRGYDVVRADQIWAVRPHIRSDIDVVVVGEGLDQATMLALLADLQAEEDPDVIALRPAADLVDTVLALEFGAAHVVEAPAGMRELAARVSGLLARRGRATSQLVNFESTTIDLKSALVMHASGEEEQLSSGQIALLRLFLANPGKVLSRDDIIAAAPAESAEAFDRSIDSRIVRLRRKLATETIVTIRGSGYRFDPPDGWSD